MKIHLAQRARKLRDTWEAAVQGIDKFTVLNDFHLLRGHPLLVNPVMPYERLFVIAFCRGVVEDLMGGCLKVDHESIDEWYSSERY